MGAKAIILSATLGSGVIPLGAEPLAVEERDIIVSVPGIPGPYCAYGAEKRLLELDGVERVELLWKEERLRIVIAAGKVVTAKQIEAAMKRADYPYDYSVLGR